MQFKDKKLIDEYFFMPTFLRTMAQDLDQFVQSQFNKELVVTSIYRRQKADSGVHADWRGIDFRDEHSGYHLFTEQEREAMMRYINNAYYRNDNYKSLIWHKVQGSVSHFHMQIARSILTYKGRNQPKHIADLH